MRTPSPAPITVQSTATAGVRGTTGRTGPNGANGRPARLPPRRPGAPPAPRPRRLPSRPSVRRHRWRVGAVQGPHGGHLVRSEPDLATDDLAGDEQHGECGDQAEHAEGDRLRLRGPFRLGLDRCGGVHVEPAADVVLELGLDRGHASASVLQLQAAHRQGDRAADRPGEHPPGEGRGEVHVGGEQVEVVLDHRVVGHDDAHEPYVEAKPRPIRHPPRSSADVPRGRWRTPPPASQHRGSSAAGGRPRRSSPPRRPGWGRPAGRGTRSAGPRRSRGRGCSTE